ncbi:PREDICTED: F-box protein SKIP22 [Camelina sativa]|uniref:F-box protein SKIP22 n=1 Tax=Camelina sativa TaxID=90675 RepID=A0ABM0TKN9_CAMSA|nr:PREDICTED: F-box protein SKIP22 [Camelina sativa]
MTIHLRNLETNETLTFEFSDESTLHDLRLKINDSTPSSVGLSINRNDEDELLAVSSQATLRSLGVKSGDLICFSLDSSDRSAFAQKKSETNHQAIEAVSIPSIQNQSSNDTTNHGGAEELGGMNLSGVKRLSEPLFLKKILMEESGDTWEFTTVVMTVHAVMLDSGFVLFNPDLGMRFSFSAGTSVSLKYTLPSVISANGTEVVTLNFEDLVDVEVYGSLDEDSLVDKVCINKRSYMNIVDLLMESDNEEVTLSVHRKVLVWWRMIKDGIVTPLLVNLCYKTGLELPPCFISLPRELKHKILASLPGVDIAALACVSPELRDMASDSDLWKQKCLEECKHLVTEGNDVVKWKEMFASYWTRKGIFSLIRAGALENFSQGAWVPPGILGRGGRNY